MPKRITDVCGICEIGKSLEKIDASRLNEEEKKEYERDVIILQKHIEVYQNQRESFNYIRNNLSSEECLIVMDFKENFRLSNGGNELSYDYYNKRQISCLGVALIFKDETNKEVIQYVSYLSEILSHDSLFSGDVLDKFFDELSNNFKYVHIYTDCGPHFRSK